MGDPVGAARAAIGDEHVDIALAEGRAMDLDQASHTPPATPKDVARSSVFAAVGG